MPPATSPRFPGVPPGLAVLTSHFNPCGYQTPRLNLKRFCEGMLSQGISPWVIELAIGNKPFHWPAGPHTIHVRSASVLWHKERLLNIAIQRLPEEIDSVAWIDGDLLFDSHDWAFQTVEALQATPIVQPFRQALYLDLQGRPVREVVSLAEAARRDARRLRDFGWAHPGFAWAARRQWIEQHRIYDEHVLGSGDSLMALALYGDWNHPLIRSLPVALREHYLEWGLKLHREAAGVPPDLPGTVRHLWHGDLVDRGYVIREMILQRHQFHPLRDLKTNTDGCWELSSPGSAFARDVESYFSGRKEDSK